MKIRLPFGTSAIIASARLSDPGLTRPFDQFHRHCARAVVFSGTTGTARTRHGDSALTALAEAGGHAVLSGHVHDPFDIPIEREGRTIRMIGAGTLSKRTRGSPPAFNEIRVEGGRFVTVPRTL